MRDRGPDIVGRYELQHKLVDRDLTFALFGVVISTTGVPCPNESNTDFISPENQNLFAETGSA